MWKVISSSPKTAMTWPRFNQGLAWVITKFSGPDGHWNQKKERLPSGQVRN